MAAFLVGRVRAARRTMEVIVVPLRMMSGGLRRA